MANKKWKNITRGKRTITRGLSENFFQKVLALLNIAISPYERSFLRFPFHIGLITLYDSYSTGLVLNVSAVSVWIHVCYTFYNSLRLCVYKNIFSFLVLAQSLFVRALLFINHFIPTNHRRLFYDQSSQYIL